MTTSHDMQELSQTDPEQLMLEVERYLDCVAVFRAEGCEPVWANDEALVDERSDDVAYSLEFRTRNRA